MCARDVPVRAIAKSPALITRARGTPDAGCVRSLACKSEKHTSEVTTKAPDTSGVPHAVVFSACFVLSPANARRLSPSSPRYRDLRPVRGRQGRTGFRKGPHDLGRRAKAMQMGRISTPVCTAQRGRQPMVCASRFTGVRAHPLYKECASLRACALTLRLRSDAAASTASRPATSDDREPPLVSEAG